MELFYFSNSEGDQKILGDFIKRNAKGGGAEFLQSNEWGNYSENNKEEVLRIGIREDAAATSTDAIVSDAELKEENILLVATLVKQVIFKNFFYWYAPRGPIGKGDALLFFFKEIKKINSRALFLRFEAGEFKENNFREEENLIFKKTINLQPAKTLLLDLNKSEEELLKEMHQKTRYNINLAKKKGLTIKEGGEGDLKEFWRLLKTTGERDNFRLHSFSHYEKLLAINKTAPGFIKLYFAQFEGKNIAAGIFSYYGDKVTYLHGASDNKFRNLMAPYLLQWSLIKFAKEEKYLLYDFYGIDEKKWPGVTRFKVGFGGQEYQYPGTYDLVIKPNLYKLYELLRKVRRLIG